MRSDEQHNPNRDFQRVRDDNPRPPHYKSRVRSLLGIPEGQGEGLGLLSVPPVGFKYADDSLIDVPYPSPRPPLLDPMSASGFQPMEEESPEEEIIESDEPQQHGVEQELNQEDSVVAPVLDVDEVSTEVPSVPEETESRVVEQEPNQEEASIHDTSQEYIAESEEEHGQTVIGPFLDVDEVSIEVPSVPEETENRVVEQERNQGEALTEDIARQLVSESVSRQAAELPARREKPQPNVQEAPVEIPGVSREKRLFPGLSDVKRTDAPSDQAEHRSRQRVPPEAKRVDPARAPLSGDQKDELVVDSVVSSADSQRQETIKGSPVATRSANRMEKLTPGETKPTRNDVATAIERKQSLQRGGSHFVNTDESGASSPDRTYPGAGFRHIGTDGFSTYDRRATETIGKLRRTVEELTSRVTELQARVGRGTEQQQPQQATIQPVVVVNRPTGRVASTRRFWERCYLSRSHLRPLR